jgi:hypothetical protein
MQNKEKEEQDSAALIALITKRVHEEFKQQYNKGSQQYKKQNMHKKKFGKFRHGHEEPSAGGGGGRRETKDNGDEEAKKLTNKKRSAPSNSEKETRTCFKCKKVGHLARYCRSKRAATESVSERANIMSEDAYLDAILALDNDIEHSIIISLQSSIYNQHANHITFYLDSGCTSHICHIEEHFDNIDFNVSIPVQAADGKTAFAAGVGNIGYLTGVYYVPGFKFNLISISKLAKSGYTIIFNASTAQVNVNGEIITIGRERNGLYVASAQLFDQPWVTMSSTAYGLSLKLSQAELKQLWHQRLAHINYSYLVNAKKKNLLLGFDYPTTANVSDLIFCNSCAEAKSTR